VDSYLGTLVQNPHNLHTLQNLIDWTHENPEECWPEYDTIAFEQCQACDSSSEEYKEALRKQGFTGGEGGIPGTIKREKLDAIIAPGPYSMVIHLAAMQGLPMVTLPLGYYPEGTKITKNKTDKLVELAPGIP